MEITSNEYYEKQKINRFFTILIVIFAGIVPIASYIFSYYLVFSNFKTTVFSKDTYMFYLSGLVVFLLSFFVVYLFLNLKLELKISKDGIYFRLFPFHRKFRFIPYSDIRYYTIRRFRPIMEYGGWGIRYSAKRNGIAYTLSGHFGLQLELNSYKRLMIGVKSPEAVLFSLKSFIPNKHIENKSE
ncbi:MAG: hypothetical protein N2560_00665 [Ignavibacteria bacterium]|nr:hypothetical protein [Ignavibacteria bacterium]